MQAQAHYRSIAKLTPILSAALLASAACCGCPAFSSPPPEPAADAQDHALLANAASLLADLLKNEKNLNKILIIKHNSADLGVLVNAIAHAAAQGENELKALAQGDPSLNLTALDLPPGERAARKAMAKTKEHELLFSSGDNFAFNLLVTQTDALSYGSHLAEIVAKNDPRRESARQFHLLSETFDRLLRQVTAQMRSLPRK